MSESKKGFKVIVNEVEEKEEGKEDTYFDDKDTCHFAQYNASYDRIKYSHRYR